MRERLTDEEIRAHWEQLQEDDPEPRHPWQWPSYEAGVRWAEDQYREALLSDLSTEDLVDARRSNSRVYDVAYSAGFLAGARVEHREAPQRREAPGLPRPVLLRVAREGAKGAAVCWTMDDVVRFVRDIRGGVFGVWSDITVEPWEAPAEPTANRLQQRREAYDAYYLANKARQPNNSPTRVLVASTFLDGWDAAEASRDPAVLSYLAKPEDPEPEDDPGDAPRRAQVEFDPEPEEPQLREPAKKLYARSDFTAHTGCDPEKYPATYEGWLACWDYLHPMLKGGVEQPEPWALQSETCACRLDSTGLHLCADSAGDVEILMRRHVWDALLSQCLLIAPLAPPEPPEPDWPAWWATMSVDLTQMRIGSPQIREGARARRFIQEIRDDGTVKLTPVVGGGADDGPLRHNHVAGEIT